MPLILPVISGEEDRGVWSSNTKQKKKLQVDQEGAFKLRSNILGFGENGGINLKNNPKKDNPRFSPADLFVFIPARRRRRRRNTSSVCLFELKCKAAISRARGDHADIKMTKDAPTGWRQRGSAHVVRGKRESVDEHIMSVRSSPQTPADVEGIPGGLRIGLRQKSPKRRVLRWI